MKNQNRTFSMNLKRLLSEKGVSQAEAAKAVGVSPQTKKGPLMCANIINDPAPEVLRTAEKEHKKEPPAMQRSFTG